ncbi:MAG: hypothetical protein M4D80_27525 [Myxococcota bacterium]|nr:hypothetical protein [Myxococcota bacterium]
MLLATHLQKRAVAVATALILLCVGLLARHHAAESAHAREHSGQIVHAQELADHHVAGATAHLHEAAVHEHAGDCSLLALAYAPLLDAAPVIIATPAASSIKLVETIKAVAGGSIAGYRLAPKTSPPTA